MSKPFIAAFKACDSLPDEYITHEQLVDWYRPTPKSTDCDSTDITMRGNPNNSSSNLFRERPDGADTLEDAIFIVVLLKSAANVTIKLGNRSQTFDAPAGISAFSAPIGVGMSFSLTRGSDSVMAGMSLKDCIWGIYN
jgi:hypothetical protein